MKLLQPCGYPLYISYTGWYTEVNLEFLDRFKVVRSYIRVLLQDPLRLKDGCERQYCGRAMGAFMLRYGITVSDLWGHRHPHRSCTIWTARLFPVAVPTGTEYEDPTLAGLFWAFDDSPQVEDQYELIE